MAHRRESREYLIGTSGILLGALLAVLAGFRKVGVDPDSLNYAGLISTSLVAADFNVIDKEPGFWLFVLIANWLAIDAVRFVFVAYAVAAVTVKMRAIGRFSLSPVFSVTLYVFVFYVLHEVTQIRAGLSAGIFLFALDDLGNGNKRKFALKVLVAALFHYSAVMAFGLIMINARKSSRKLYLWLPVLSFALVLVSQRMGQVFDAVTTLASVLPSVFSAKLLLYINLVNAGEHNELNIFSPLYLIMLLTHVFISVAPNVGFSRYEVVAYKVHAISITAFYLLSAVPVVAFRVSEFFAVTLIILYPNFIARNFRGYDAWALRFAVIAWASVYFFAISVGRNIHWQVLV